MIKKGEHIGAELMGKVLADIKEGKLTYRRIANKYDISSQVVSSIAIKNGIRKHPPHKKSTIPSKTHKWNSELTTEWELTTKWFLEELHEKEKASRRSTDNSIFSFCNIYRAGRGQDRICQLRRGAEGEIKARDKQ